MSNKKRLVGNIFSLAVVQGANFIVPLITLPYLVKTLGPEVFGILVLAQTIVQYFVILTDYGFNLSATKAVSIARDNTDELSRILSSVTLLKTWLLLLGLAILLGLLLIIKPLSAHWPVYLVCYLTVLGNVAFPFWFFQGLEQVRWVSLLSIVARVATLVGLVVWVKHPQDLLLAAFLQSLSGLITGILAFFILRKQYPKLHWVWPKQRHLRETLREGWPVFLTTLSFTAYTSYPVLILGLLFGNASVGIYSAGEKVIRAIAQGLFQPVHQALFPHVSLLAKQSREQVMGFNRRVLLILLSALGVVAIALSIGAGWIVGILFDPRYSDAKTVIVIMSLLPMFTAISGVLGANTLLALGYNLEFGRTYMMVAVIGLPLTGFLAYALQQSGAAIAALLTEAMVSLIILRQLYQLGILQRRSKT